MQTVSASDWNISYTDDHEDEGIVLNVHRSHEIPNEHGGIGVSERHAEHDGRRFPDMDHARDYALSNGLLRPYLRGGTFVQTDLETGLHVFGSEHGYQILRNLTIIAADLPTLGDVEDLLAVLRRSGEPEPTTQQTVPVELIVKRNGAGKVLAITVLPREGDAGYFGPRQSDAFWDAVTEYLSEIQLIGADEIATYPLRWEG